MLAVGDTKINAVVLSLGSSHFRASGGYRNQSCNIVN